MKRTLLFLFVIATNILHAQTTVQFTSAADNGWLSGGNWSTGAVPGLSALAVFNSQPNGNGSNNGCNINFSDPSTNNGATGQIVGAIRVLSTRTRDMNVGNSSPSVDGVLSLNGLSINGTPGVVIDNQMPSPSTLNINNAIVGNNRVMKLALNSDAVIQGAATSITTITTEVTVAGAVTLAGGTLQLDRRNGNTFPATTNFTVNSGTLRISTNQTINNLDLKPGTTLQIDGNTTVTINGTFVHRGANIVLAASSSVLQYGPNATLDYAGSSLQNVTASEWPVTNGPRHIIITNSTGVSLSAARTIAGNLTVNGNLATGTNALTAAAAVVNSGGKIQVGSLNSSGALADNIRTSGGIVLNPGSTIEFNGAGAQYISANSYANVIVNNNSNGVLLAGDVSISGVLTLNSATKIDLAGRALTLAGTVAGAGTFKGSPTSVLNLSSASALGNLQFDQTIDSATNSLGTLSLSSGSAILASKLTIYAVLNVSGGTLDLGGQNLVLKSSATNTARVAPVAGTINNATNVTVERHFPNAGRRYRLVSPGVTTTTTIRDNWMEGAMNTTFCTNCNVDPKPGYGTHITGKGGNANGFDVTTTNNPSLYTYNQAIQNWTAVTTTTLPLNATTPYMIFLRGDRSVNMTHPGNVPVSLPGSGTVLRTTGALPVGNRLFTGLASDGKQSLLANPFPSPISWAAIFANNSAQFENYYTYWEPKVGQRGAYVTVTNSGLRNNVNSTATEQIQSGQAFFVTTKAGVASPSLTIREQDKSTTSNINVFRMAGNTVEKFYVSLNFTESDGKKYNADGVLIAYSPQFSASLDEDDAVQIAAMDEDIAILREGKLLSIETRDELKATDTILLSLARLKAGQNYEWQFTPETMATKIANGWLIDKFQNTRTVISLTDTTWIPFQVTGVPGSAATDRFMIVFRAETMATLPVNFTAVKAFQPANTDAVHVAWQIAAEENLQHYTVEKSGDGRSFTVIGSVSLVDNTGSYLFVDKTPFAGTNYYRVKAMDTNGQIRYSSVAMVKLGGSQESFAIYPNPSSGSTINLRFVNLPKGDYVVQIVNSGGAQVFRKAFHWAGGTGSEVVQLAQPVVAGMYQVFVQGSSLPGINLLVKE